MKLNSAKTRTQQSGTLSPFDTLVNDLQCGIDEEITYTEKECKAYTIEVNNGILISSIGDSSIYLFELNTLLPPVEDSEVNVAIEDSLVSGTIIRLEGFEIEIMLKGNFGKSIPKAKLSFEPTWLLKKLLERFAEIRNGELQFNKELSYKTLYPPAQVEYDSVELTQLTPISKDGKKSFPRKDQVEAIKHSLTLDVSFIWGPPGTGKTTTLAWMVEALLKKDKRVLVVSHANVAVDNAIEKVVELLNDNKITQENRIIRFPEFRFTNEKIRKLADFKVICKDKTAELNKQLLDLREQCFFEHIKVNTWKKYHDMYLLRDQMKQELTMVSMNNDTEKKKLLQFDNEIASIQQQINDLEMKLEKAKDSSSVKRFFLGLNLQKLESLKNDRIIKLDNARTLRNDINKNIQDQKHNKTVLTMKIKILSEALNLPSVDIEIECITSSCGEMLKTTLDSPEGEIICPKCGNTYLYKGIELPCDVQLTNVKKRIEVYEYLVQEIEQRIKIIQEEIDNIKAKILSEAKVVAATLTKVHIASELYKGLYDVIILDEASMAPLPSIFFTSGLAKEKYVIFGDFCQLGPICRASHAQDNECLNAKKWLGSDIYLRTGIVDDNLRIKNPNRIKALILQSRMISSISTIVKKFIYQERGLDLNDVEDRKINDKTRICLYDTSQWNPWCSRSISWSHYNVRQALLTLQIAKKIAKGRRKTEKVVVDDRRKNSRREKTTIITPYREQARLLKTLLDSQKQLSHQITVSSIYQFQGRETNRLILDFVDGNPLRYLGKPFLGIDGIRLLNVALSRAKNEIHIICNYDYFKKKSSEKSRLVLSVLDYIKENYEVCYVSESTYSIDADQVIQVDKLLYPYTQDKLPETYGLYTHENFDSQFRKDIEKAQESIIICSPFLTDKRVAKFMDLFYAKAKQGVKIGVYTRRASRQRSFSFGDVKATIEELRKIGVKVLESTRRVMHEKIIVVDDIITWDGSLNSLSHGGYTSESMIRIMDKDLTDQYKRLHGLDDFFQRTKQIERRMQILQKLNSENNGLCPKCFKPIEAFYSTRQRCLAYHCSTGELHHFKYVPGEKILALLDDRDKKCPKCGKPIISKTIQRGKQLLSCSGYPDCRFILNI
jgi:hypothetical protein